LSCRAGRAGQGQGQGRSGGVRLFVLQGRARRNRARQGRARQLFSL